MFFYVILLSSLTGSLLFNYILKKMEESEKKQKVLLWIVQ